MFFSLGSVALVYLIGKQVYGKGVGEISALILAFTPVFFESTFRIMTEIPSVFFGITGFVFLY